MASRRRALWVTLGVLALGLGACRHGGEESRRAAVPVRVRTVEPHADALATRYSGTIAPATQVDLAFRVGGYVDQILQVREGQSSRIVQEGDEVKKGTILASIRQADYQQRSAAANAAVAEAAAAEKQAQLDFDRASALFAQTSISKAELDAATVRIETARARTAAARAQAGQAAVALGDTRLAAPIDGVLLKRSVEVGSLVAPGTPAFVIADLRSVKVVFGAPDILTEKLRIGGRVTVTVETRPGDVQATVTRIAPAADPRMRVFDVEARLDNSDGSLKPGMIATLAVARSTLAENALLLPLTAVVRSPHDARGFAVFLVEGAGDGTVARLRDVELGEVIGNDVLAVKGLAAGDRVVYQGATIVTDGAPVSVIP